MKEQKKFALVLSGGGAKGAWEIGFLKYVVERWGQKFHAVSANSIGALNAMVYVSTASDPNMAEKLADPWNKISFGKVAKIPLSDIFSLKFYSLLDNSPLLDFVNQNLDMASYRSNIDKGVVDSYIITTTDLTSKKLHVWVDSKDDVDYLSPAWVTKKQELNGSHAVASGAIPIVFRSQQLETGSWHVDAGLVTNTPIAPALSSFFKDRTSEPDTTEDPRVKVLVLTLPEPEVKQEWTSEPTILTQISRMFEALTVNQILQDVAKAKMINNFLDTVGADSCGKYRRIDLLLARPNQSLNAIAGDVSGEIMWGLIPKGWAASLSFLLIFQPYIQALLKAGYEDAAAMHDQLEEFFNS